MTSFDFEQHKRQAVKKLEAIEKVRLDYEALLRKLEDIDIAQLVQDAVKTEINRIMRYAKEHDIPFQISVDELVRQVKLPTISAPGNTLTQLPFVPDRTETIIDTDGDDWHWDSDIQEWVKVNDWESSSCGEWESSQNC